MPDNVLAPASWGIALAHLALAYFSSTLMRAWKHWLRSRSERFDKEAKNLDEVKKELEALRAKNAALESSQAQTDRVLALMTRIPGPKEIATTTEEQERELFEKFLLREKMRA